MTQEVRDFVIEKTKDLMAAHSCSAEAKAAAQAWLDAAGTEKEAEQPDILKSLRRILCRWTT